MKQPTRSSDVMWIRLFHRVQTQSSTLQGQLRDMFMHAILEGFILPGEALPSSRALAQSLGLSRTTAMLAIQALVDKGVVVGKPRSGYFVSKDLLSSHLDVPKCADKPTTQDAASWKNRLVLTPSLQHNIEKPLDWQQQPYPFVYGQFDANLFSASDWRECVLEVLQPRVLRRWAPDHIDHDESALVEQIQRRLLPARGIWVDQNQILVTSGAQQAIFMLCELLIGPTTRVGIENPGYPDARNNFLLRSRRVRPLAVDSEGLIPGPDLSHCDYVFVTPSHQCPTTVTMSLNRRRALLQYAQRDDFIVIEDDHESELNFLGKPSPALKSLDTTQHVIYMGSLSKTLAHGLRLGFVVAPAELIQELRTLRRLIMRHVPTNNQCAAASFIAHGHHEAFIHRLNAAYRARAAALRAALITYAPELEQVASHGGSALWVAGPDGLDTRELSHRLYMRGVVVEPGEIFFSGDTPPKKYMRLGYSSIPEEKIEAGARILADELERVI